jgi:hypothetical protein
MADLGSSEDSTWSVLLLNDDHTQSHGEKISNDYGSVPRN